MLRRCAYSLRSELPASVKESSSLNAILRREYFQFLFKFRSQSRSSEWFFFHRF